MITTATRERDRSRGKRELERAYRKTLRGELEEERRLSTALRAALQANAAVLATVATHIDFVLRHAGPHMDWESLDRLRRARDDLRAHVE